MMERFKVGDRVRLIDNSVVFTVEEIQDGDGHYAVWGHGLPNAYYSCGLGEEMIKN